MSRFWQKKIIHKKQIQSTQSPISHPMVNLEISAMFTLRGDPSSVDISYLINPSILTVIQDLQMIDQIYILENK